MQTFKLATSHSFLNFCIYFAQFYLMNLFLVMGLAAEVKRSPDQNDHNTNAYQHKMDDILVAFIPFRIFIFKHERSV